MLANLPEKYYLGHAHELFAFVSQHCSQLLETEHREYLDGLAKLGSDAQCLLVRMLARKPKFFTRASLAYPEIENLTGAISELNQNGYVSQITTADWSSFVPALNKAQLLECLQNTPRLVRAATPKAELVALVMQSLCGDEPELAEVKTAWLARRQQTTVDYILFLYFGDLNNRLQKFAMRDLGVLKTRKPAYNTTARFTDLAEAKIAFKLHRLKRDYRAQPQETREQAITYLHSAAPHQNSEVNKVRDKLILQVAHDVYKNDPLKAISLWQQTNHTPALEKWVRATHRHGCRTELENQLLSLRKSTLPAASRIFIEDFYQRKYRGKRTSVYTDMLREANHEIAIDECYLGDVEEGVLQHYHRNGAQAWFTENKLWRVLFGFTLWPILYDNHRTQHSEFDHLPAALRERDFYQKHKARIEQRLRLLGEPKKAMQEFTRLAATEYGTQTGLFRWSSTILDTLAACVFHSPQDSLAKVIRHMCCNYTECNSGYPDLMVLDQDGLRFEEVKAPGDSLRPNQLVSIERLRDAGLEVEMCQVNWATDPQQIYAVVDIETTGGRKGGNAITEIAVVRVQNQEIISEWSSLINPGRAIPAHITRLTSINNQMVANAPNFNEIAHVLDEQLDQAIFVAHNVGFDYGFIKAAYAAMGRGFRKPKYCTVQHARKAFPNLKSYSLGNLTKAFDIDLKNAHRALSDARATAHLLRLIQSEAE